MRKQLAHLVMVLVMAGLVPACRRDNGGEVPQAEPAGSGAPGAVADADAEEGVEAGADGPGAERPATEDDSMGNSNRGDTVDGVAGSEGTPPANPEQSGSESAARTTGSDEAGSSSTPAVTAADGAPAQDDAAEPSLPKGVSPQAVEVLEPIGDELLAKWFSYETVSAKMLYRFNRNSQPKTRQAGRGERHSRRLPDGRVLVRSTVTNNVTQENLADNPEMPWFITAGRVSRYSDGRYAYTVNETRFGTTVTKQWASLNSVLYIGGPRLLRRLLAMDDLSRLPDQSVESHDCYVFRGTARDGTVSTFFIAKDTGLLIKLVTENKAKETNSELTLSDIELDVEFPPDHFEFSMPEGAEFKDMTVSGSAAEPAAAASPDTSE